MSDVVDHYERYSEQERLSMGYGPLELARSQELIARRLPRPPATVLDVGGGPGIYSCWLARQGYEVHLVDPVPKHIEQASEASHAQSGHPIASITLGDARKLPFPDGFADAVLLMGPMYHLTARDDRIAALREARRVLRPKGPLCAVAICRYASLFDSLARGFIEDPRFAPILERDLRDGQHRNTTGNLDYFTTAFFHLPDELRAEVEEAGFSALELAAIEGPCWLARDFARLDDLLRWVRVVEHEPALLGASPHLMAIAVK